MAAGVLRPVNRYGYLRAIQLQELAEKKKEEEEEEKAEDSHLLRKRERKKEKKREEIKNKIFNKRGLELT